MMMMMMMMMMKKQRDTSIRYFLMVFFMITVVSTLCSSAFSVEIAGNFQLSCNRSVGDCMGGGTAAYNDEFLMESDVSSRILATTNSLSYNSLTKSPVCNAAVYGNCIKQSNTGSRTCTYYNKCKRSV